MDLSEINARRSKHFFDFIRTNLDGVRLFPRQIQLGAEIMGDWCPDCNPDVQLRDESHEWIAQNIVFREHGVCPLCGSTPCLGLNRHTALAAGQRGGKTMLGYALLLYAEQKALVSQHYRIEDKVLVNAWIDSTMNHAMHCMREINGLRTGIPWFKEYFELLTAENFEPVVNDIGCQYRHIELSTRVVPADPNVIDDLLLYFTVVDDAAWLGTDGPRSDLAPVLKAVNNSSAPVRKLGQPCVDFIGGKVVATSSLREPGDTFSRMLELNDEQHYSKKIPSWSLNPRLARDHFHAEFSRDPYKANRDFGCRFVRL